MNSSLKSLVIIQVHALAYLVACQRFTIQTFFVEAPDQIFSIQQVFIQPHLLAILLNLF